MVGTSIFGNDAYSPFTDLGTTYSDNTKGPFFFINGSTPILFDGVTSPTINVSAYSAVVVGTTRYELSSLYYPQPGVNAGINDVLIVVIWNSSDGHGFGDSGRVTTVVKAEGAVSFSNLTQAYDGGQHYPTVNLTIPSKYTLTYYDAAGAVLGTATDVAGYNVKDAGTYTVNVHVDGTEAWTNPGINATATFTITKATPRISLNPTQVTYTGNPVQVTPTVTNISAFLLEGSGPPLVITYNGSTTPPTNVGSYVVVASIDDPNYEFASIASTLTINKKSQTLQVSSLPPSVLSTVEQVNVGTVTSSSGLPVLVSVTGPAIYSDGVVSLTGEAGTVSVIYTQSGNDYYESVSVTKSFSVVRATQTIFSVPSFPDLIWGTQQSITVTEPLSSSGLPVYVSVISGPATVSGNIITVSGAIGEVRLQFNQGGNQYIDPAPPLYTSFRVDKIKQNLVFGGVPSTIPPTTTSFTFVPPTSQSGSPVTISISGVATLSGNVVTLTGSEGNIYIVASTPETDTYRSASTTVSVQVKKTPQKITPFNITPIQAVYSNVVHLNTITASSGLPVQFSVSNGPASFSGTDLTFTGTGTVTISASQPGDATYASAPVITQTFVVAPKPVTFTFAAPFSSYFTTVSTNHITVNSDPANIAYNVIYTDSQGNLADFNNQVISPGKYTVTVTSANPNYITTGVNTTTYTVLSGGPPIAGTPFISGVDTYGYPEVGKLCAGFIQYLFGYTYDPTTGLPHDPGQVLIRSYVDPSNGTTVNEYGYSQVLPIRNPDVLPSWITLDNTTGFFYGIPPTYGEYSGTNPSYPQLSSITLNPSSVNFLNDNKVPVAGLSSKGDPLTWSFIVFPGNPKISLRQNYEIPVYIEGQSGNYWGGNRYFVGDFINIEVDSALAHVTGLNSPQGSAGGAVGTTGIAINNDAIYVKNMGIGLVEIFIPSSTNWNESNHVFAQFEVRRQLAPQYLNGFPSSLPTFVSPLTAPIGLPELHSSANIPAHYSVISGPAFITRVYPYGYPNTYASYTELIFTGQTGMVVLEATSEEQNGYAVSNTEYWYIFVVSENSHYNSLNKFGAGNLF